MPVTKCIRDALDQLATTVEAVTGIRAVYGDPPEAINAFPAGYVYVSKVSWTYGPGATTKKGIVTIGLDIHIPRLRKNLQRGIIEIVSYAETVPNAILKDPTLGGSVDVILRCDAVLTANTIYAGTDTMAWFYEIDVKIENSIT